MTPHKHAAVIKAWADGAAIERRFAGTAWHPFPSYAIWEEAAEYRVKPVPHKWQKEMDAFAAGKCVDCRSLGGGKWHTWEPKRLLTPSWDHLGLDFRITPERVVVYQPLVMPGCDEAYATLAEGKEAYSRTVNVVAAWQQVTFEDNKLIESKVL